MWVCYIVCCCRPIGVPSLSPELLNCTTLQLPPFSTCASEACPGSSRTVELHCWNEKFFVAVKYVGVVGAVLTTATAMVGSSFLGRFHFHAESTFKVSLSLSGWTNFRFHFHFRDEPTFNSRSRRRNRDSSRSLYDSLVQSTFWAVLSPQKHKKVFIHFQITQLFHCSPECWIWI